MPETWGAIAVLAAAIWTARVMLPRALREDDRFALVCTILTFLAALFALLFVGMSVRSR